MIIRSGGAFPRRVFRAGPGLQRPRFFGGPRRFGYGGVRRGPYFGGYRPRLRGMWGARPYGGRVWGARPYGSRLASW